MRKSDLEQKVVRLSATQRARLPRLSSGEPRRQLTRNVFLGNQMARAALWLLLCAIALAARGEEPLPADVKSFVEQRDVCDHFRGEPYGGPSDSETVEQRERREFVLASQEKYCTGTDKRLAELKLKYGGDSRVLDRLNRYDTQIEPR